MATVFEWKVMNMACHASHEGFDDVVYNVGWKLMAVDGDYTANVSSSNFITFDPNKPFVEFNQLSEDEVVNWVKNALGDDEVVRIEQNLIAEILNIKNPTIVNRLPPWEQPDKTLPE